MPDTICSVGECRNRSKARGMCSIHYQRAQRASNGSLDYMARTVGARGRRKDRPAGKSRIAVYVDEWLYDWVKAQAIRSKRSVSAQAEMMLVRFAEGKIK